MSRDIHIRSLRGAAAAQLDELADVLIDCVQSGASVGFMQPLSRQKAVDFWRHVAAQVAEDRRALFIAEEGGRIAGTVQLVLGLPENQPHRAEISKMLVHRRARRRGVGAALLRSAEEHARSLGKTLLVLDTASVEAERLYARAGWIKVGVVPGFALWPEGGPCDTTFYYRRLT